MTVNLGIIYGGRSGEHDFNLAACGRIVTALSAEKYNIKPIKILKDGLWLCPDGFWPTVGVATDTSAIDEWILKNYSPNNAVEALQKIKNDGIQVLWLAAYGEFSEDGSLQGLCELLDIPYIGSGVISSAVNYDKEFFYHTMLYHGLNVAPFKVIKKKEWENNKVEVLQRLFDLEFPLVVKPADRGLSIGAFFSENTEDLSEKMGKCFETTNKIIIQKYLKGYEINCAILNVDNNSAPIALPPIAVRPRGSPIFDFETKVGHRFDEEIPPKISSELLEKVKNTAIKVFQTTDCEAFSRVELMVVEDKIYVQENNTLPGIGSELSLFPKAAKMFGITYGELINKLIEHALRKEKNLNRAFNIL